MEGEVQGGDPNLAVFSPRRHRVLCNTVREARSDPALSMGRRTPYTRRLYPGDPTDHVEQGRAAKEHGRRRQNRQTGDRARRFPCV